VEARSRRAMRWELASAIAVYHRDAAVQYARIGE
jgi:hypothetical protein